MNFRRGNKCGRQKCVTSEGINQYKLVCSNGSVNSQLLQILPDKVVSGKISKGLKANSIHLA